MIHSLSIQGFQECTSNVLLLLNKPLEFRNLTVIIGDNGSGKSQLIGMILAGIDPDWSYSKEVSWSMVNKSPYPHYRQLASQGYINVVWDRGIPVIYHQGQDPDPVSFTSKSRVFGSHGEGVLYDLLQVMTVNFMMYCPYFDKPGVSGSDVIKFKREITRRFVFGDLPDLKFLTPAVLVADEPELGLSPIRVKAVVKFFTSWVSHGNQLIITTNHPWMIGNWPVSLNPLVIDLDKYGGYAPDGFSYSMSM